VILVDMGGLLPYEVWGNTANTSRLEDAWFVVPKITLYPVLDALGNHE